jgi:hypothetical protein
MLPCLGCETNSSVISHLTHLSFNILDYKMILLFALFNHTRRVSRVRRMNVKLFLEQGSSLKINTKSMKLHSGPNHIVTYGTCDYVP